MWIIILLTLNLPLVASLGGKEGVLVGGRKDATGQIKTTEEPVGFAVKAINDWLSGEQISQVPRKLVKIVKAETQVVAGEKLYLTLQLSPQQPGAKDEYCDIEVVFKPWLKGSERLAVSGQPVCSQTPPETAADKNDGAPEPVSDKTPDLLGGRKPMNTQGLPQEALLALNFAVNEVNRRSNNLYLFSLGSLDGVKATQQMVAGKMFCFNGVPLQETGCNKMTDVAAIKGNKCSPTQSGQRMVCDLCVWWQAWRDPQYTLEDFDRNSCSMTSSAPSPR